MSTITITLTGTTDEQTKRIARILGILFDQQLFNIRNGRAVLHFDVDGVLRVIDWETTKWRKEKFTLPVFIEAFEKFTIDME